MLDKPLNLVSLFSGIGSWEMALDYLSIPYNLVNYAEFGKNASAAYCKIHDVDPIKNLGDISKLQDKDFSEYPEIDLFTYSFPCTSLSVCGKGEGMKKGSNTASSLFWDSLDLASKLKPKIMIAENVPALLNKVHFGDFKHGLIELSKIGYDTQWFTIKASDYGSIQGRERVFIVSARKDINFFSSKDFTLPEIVKHNRKIQDILETDVDSSYFLKDEIVSLDYESFDKNTYGKNTYNKIITIGQDIRSKFEVEKRILSIEGLCFTQISHHAPKILDLDLKARFLTPLEQWRVMNFPENKIEKIFPVLLSKKTND